jgi:magnesium transporter
MEENKNEEGHRDVIQLDDEILSNISTLIEERAAESLLNIVLDLHPADTAEILNHIKFDDAKYLFHLLPTETAGEVIVELDESLRERLLEHIDADKITDIVDELDVDDATDIVADLPDDVAEQVLDNIDPEYSDDVKELLKYPEDSAGGIMNSDFIEINEKAAVKDAIEEIRKNSAEIDHIYHIYVVNDAGQLVGLVLLKNLLLNPLDTPISSLIEEDLFSVEAEADQEEAANMMEKYDLIALPVVDKNRKMLGRITIDDIVDVIHEEAAEDIQKIAGLSEEEEFAHSIFRVSRIRLPWLLFGLMGEMVSAIVLSSFQASIEKVLISSFFVPIVMAMGGSSGTQSAIVVVRAMATSEVWMGAAFSRLSKEFGIALLNGLACSFILLLATHFFWEANIGFSIVLSISLLIIMINATMIGAMAPILLNKMNIDPAIATGPFVATANDILGLLIYFLLLTNFYAG